MLKIREELFSANHVFVLSISQNIRKATLSMDLEGVGIILKSSVDFQAHYGETIFHGLDKTY